MKKQIQRTEQKVNKKRRSAWPVKRKQVAPRTAKDFFAKSEAFQDKFTRVANVVSKMRADGVSLAQASGEYKLAPHTVLRWGRTALRKGANGRYAAKASDRLVRVMVVLTHGG